MRSEISIARRQSLSLGVPDRALGLVFVVLLSLPGLVGLTGREARARAVAGEPPVVLRGLAAAGGIGPWLRELQGYLGASFGLRHQLVGWDARLKRTLGLSQSYGSDVTHGRDGWLFYRVHRGTQGIRPEVPFAADELDRWTAAIEVDRQRAESHGAAFIFIAAPDKDTVYPDLLPPELPPAGPVSRLDALTARLRADGVTVVDLRPALRSARAEGARFARWPLYFRTDSHWNTLGGLAAARRVLAALQQRFPGVHVPTDEEITVSSAETGGGDLARMDGLQGAVSDLWVRATVRTARCVVDPFDPAAASPETPTALPGRLDCPGAPIRRALVLHDSMMAAMLPFLAPAFERATLLQSPLLSPDRMRLRVAPTW